MRNGKIWTRPSLSASSPIFCFYFSIFVAYIRPHSAGELWTSSHSFWLASAILWSVKQLNHVNKARVLVRWKLPTHCSHVIYELTNTKKLGENVAENKDKLFLSSTVCTRVCRLFFCRSLTPTWVFQNEFANISLTYKERFTLHCWWLLLSCTYVVFVVVIVFVYNHLENYYLHPITTLDRLYRVLIIIQLKFPNK